MIQEWKRDFSPYTLNKALNFQSSPCINFSKLYFQEAFTYNNGL